MNGTLGGLIRHDPFVRSLAGALILLVAMLTCAWSCFLATASLNALLAADLFTAVNVVIDNYMPVLGRLGTDYVSAIVAVVPIALAAVCHTRGRPLKLNFWGRSTLLLSVLGAVGSFVALTVLKAYPDRMVILGTDDVAITLAETSEIALRTSLFYVGGLLGVRLLDEK
jgi:hypothetical protein